MDRRIRVDSELRARDVPPGTTVTPRGREYIMLGLLGGWVAGGICMHYVWDIAAPAISAVKVFGAATAGSLLGKFMSWFLPSTRRRMRVIRELKVQLKEERAVEAQAAAEVPGRTVRQAVGPGPAARDTASREWRESDMAAADVGRSQSRQQTQEPAPPVVYVSPNDVPPAARPLDIDRVERPQTVGNTDALVQALEQFGQDGDEKKRKR